MNIYKIFGNLGLENID